MDPLPIALTCGLGLKPQHYESALGCDAAGIWFEVHAENYMVDGGPRPAWLAAIGARHPLSLHGVGLSLAADAEPDAAHLRRLASLVDRYDPALVSEHLAWSHWRGAYYPDLLPFPRTRQALARIAANIGRTQDALRRPIAIENPSHYLRIDGHEFDEIDFLVELTRRTGCRLLLDLNNVVVSANNVGADPNIYANAYVDSFPVAAVSEIHLAGHSEDPRLGARLLIDSHDAPIAPAVWALYERFIALAGPRPTLIERDDKLPAFEVLLQERTRADRLLRAAPPGSGAANAPTLAAA